MTAGYACGEQMGTARGMFLHAVAEEQPCTECARGDLVRRLELERFTPHSLWREQQRRAVLEATE